MNKVTSGDQRWVNANSSPLWSVLSVSWMSVSMVSWEEVSSRPWPKTLATSAHPEDLVSSKTSFYDECFRIFKICKIYASLTCQVASPLVESSVRR